jgi:replication initiation protein RepC
MKTINSAATAAGTPSSYVQAYANADFIPIFRRDLMRALRTTRRNLRLSTGDLLVMDALLSFLPCRNRATGTDRPVSPDMMLIVYAGNATVCERANGMDERVLRRHLVRLETTGLIRRKLSATGKRFPLKSNGAVRDAFGVDLTPLLERHHEISDLACRVEQNREEIRGLRAEALALRGQLLDAADRLTEAALAFVERVRTILRRANLTPGMIRDMMDELRAIRDGRGETRRPPAPQSTALNTISDHAVEKNPYATSAITEDEVSSPVPAYATGTRPGQNNVTESGSCPGQRHETFPAATPGHDGPLTPDKRNPATDRDAAGGLSAVNQDRTVALNTAPSGSRPCLGLPQDVLSAVNAAVPECLKTDEQSGGNGQNVRQVESPKINTYYEDALDANTLRLAWQRHPYICEFLPEAPRTPSELLEKIYLFGGMMNLKRSDLLSALGSLGWLGTVSALEYLAKKAVKIMNPPSYLKKMVHDYDAGRPVGWLKRHG